ncbi:MAG: radical SAM protein [Bacteroidales bacterium]|nr:radical SAM protein [Bacteroidales bacterium]
MLREEVVFGPIASRRLGRSLGINLLPEKGKLCNFDCIYCECGLNRDGREDRRLPAADRVREALAEKCRVLRREDVAVDSITFSGDGEPTLHPEFPRIIGDTLALRDRFFPEARVSVLSNATRLEAPGVFEALCKVDNPIMKLDAPTNALAARINAPAPGYDVARVVENLKRFRGNFILQTMFLRSADFDSSAPDVLLPWMEIVRTLSPRLVMAYTLSRPAPVQGLQKFGVAQMEALLAPLREAGIAVEIYG